MVRYHGGDRKRKSMTVDEDWMKVPITFPPVGARDLSNEALQTEREMMVDVAETFNNLWQIDMKLNIKKCSFGVEEEQSLPFFEMLKNITKQNKYDYLWMEEAKNAFQELKKIIIDLTSLTTPKPKETLYIYLAVAQEAASAVLLAERKGKQCRVHYVHVCVQSTKAEQLLP
ncbi:reverse transcriptase domain-containing protein [Tanacetum coccineum]